MYEQAAADPQAWWAGQARQRLDRDTPFTEVLDDSEDVEIFKRATAFFATETR